MTAPNQDVCSAWATVDDVCEPCNTYALDLTLLDDWLLVASNILYRLTGRQWPGICQDTVRPVPRYEQLIQWSQLRDWQGVYGWSGSSLDGRTGLCGCNRTDRAVCRSVPEITLGGSYPITSVVQILVDGAVLNPARYRVDDNFWLVRLPDADGTRPGFPCCNDQVLASTEPDTWQVTYTFGSLPDSGGVKAAASLGCQLYLACEPETTGGCRLPQRVTHLSRQGVDITVLDPLDLFEQGRTGLPEVDLWIQSVNPGKISRRATVLSPDAPRRVRRTGT